MSAVDLLSEDLIPLAEVPDHLPKCGRRASIASVYRWAKDGVRGVALESAPVGGLRYTSKEAIARFLQALADRSGAKAGATAAGPPAAPARKAMPAHRRQQIEAAEKKLRKSSSR